MYVRCHEVWYVGLNLFHDLLRKQEQANEVLDAMFERKVGIYMMHMVYVLNRPSTCIMH